MTHVTHKNAAINYLINRMNTHPITAINKTMNGNTYKQYYLIIIILHANTKENINQITLNRTHYLKSNKNGPSSRTSKKKPEPSCDYLEIQTAFRTTNTIRNQLKTNRHTTDTFNKSGVY
jgi:hypothetical protein